MLWFSAVLVAAVSNLDNLAAGFAYGVRDTRIGVVPNAVIAAVTMAGTAVALTSGRALGTLMPSSLAGDVGALIVISIGLGMVVAAIRALRRRVAAAEREPPAWFDADSNRSVLFSEALVLGVALSLNNVGTGVGAGIAGVPPLATTVLAGAISLLCVGGGCRIGWSTARPVLGRRAPFAAGLVLVGLGAAMLSGAG